MLARTDTSTVLDGEPWSDADDASLTAMYMMVPLPPSTEIARTLGRTVSAVHARSHRLRLSALRIPGAKMRPCIVEFCGRAFLSEHKFNRICPMCAKSDLVRCA